MAAALSLTLAFSVLAGARSGWSVRLLGEIPLLAALATLAVLDLRSRLLPDVVTLPALAYALALAAVGGSTLGLSDAALGALIGGGAVLALAIASRGSIGGGDIKLTALLGASLGWKDALVSLAFSQLVGSAIVLGIVIMRCRRSHGLVPVGALIALLGSILLVGRP